MSKQEKAFGSKNLAAEMAATMGEDPRPHLSEAEIQEQLKISSLTREQWDAEWDRRIKCSAPF